MASKPLYPVPTDKNWSEGLTQPSVVVNDNARRAEIHALPALGFEATQPATPADGDLVVMDPAWGGGADGDLAYFYDSAWSTWTPFIGQRKHIGGVEYIFVAGSPDAWATYVSTLGDYADDAAAAAGTVPVGGEYRTGSVRKLRVA